MKKLLLLWLTLASAIPGHTELAFLAVGDWGCDGKNGQRENAVQMGRTAALLHCRLILSLGDNFYDKGVRSTTDPQWKTSFDDIYTAESLQVPWYAVLGNHDYLTNPQAQVDRIALGSRWRMLARYYTWTEVVDAQTKVQFFCLDTTALVKSYRTSATKFSDVATQNADAQLAWLERELATSRAQWKIVCGHHPVYSASKTHGDTPDLIARLKPLLDRYGVQAYLAGHDHDMQHLRDAGPVEYFVSGAGSAVRSAGRNARTLFSNGDTSGFLAARLTAERMRVEFIDHRGRVLYSTEVSRHTDKALAGTTR